jgi:hypothetical protein
MGLAVLTCIGKLSDTNDYAKATMRGGSAVETDNGSKGKQVGKKGVLYQPGLEVYTQKLILLLKLYFTQISKIIQMFIMIVCLHLVQSEFKFIEQILQLHSPQLLQLKI